MRFVPATFALPIGVAWSVTARASLSARGSVGWMEGQERHHSPEGVLDVLSLGLFTTAGVGYLAFNAGGVYHTGDAFW